MAKLTVKDIPISNKKVFVRVDFNVPLDSEQHITDDTRIRAALPTINYILEQGGIPILASHLGRPKGRIVRELSLTPVAEHLVKLLKRKVVFAPDCVGDEVKKMSQSLKSGDVMLLENTRFHPEEKNNDPAFSKDLASLADFYVNDAFGTAHRAHASVVGAASFFNDPVCGFLMEKEINYLAQVLQDPQTPLLAIIGGAKVSTKIGVIKNLLKNVDHLVIGGGMGFTFYKAKGYGIGKSLCEDSFVDEAKSLLDDEKLYLPVDVLVACEAKPGSMTKNVEASAIPPDYLGVDIGTKSIAEIADLVGRSKTIVWNGPMGIFEIDEFSGGSKKVAGAIVEATDAGALSIVGGGDTVAALKKFGVYDKITHVSTGGGASLEFLEGKELPGIKILKEK